MSGTARIVVDAAVARVFAPYELRTLVRTFPGRRWDPALKCWKIDVSQVDGMAAALRAAGCTVYVTRTNGSPWGADAGRDGVRSTPGAGWAEALFAAVGPDHAERCFRALVRVLHPDAGGDHVLMQELNAARRQLGAGR